LGSDRDFSEIHFDPISPNRIATVAAPTERHLPISL
jgi:hypothetical protein